MIFSPMAINVEKVKQNLFVAFSRYRLFNIYLIFSLNTMSAPNRNLPSQISSLYDKAADLDIPEKDLELLDALSRFYSELHLFDGYIEANEFVGAAASVREMVNIILEFQIT